MTGIDGNAKSQEIVVYNENSQNHIPLIKNRNLDHKELSKKQFYEITTIEEDEESQGSTNYHNLGLGNQKGMRRYGDLNSDLLPTDHQSTKVPLSDKQKPRGISVRKHQTHDPIDESPEINLVNPKQKSVAASDTKAVTDEDQSKKEKKKEGLLKAGVKQKAAMGGSKMKIKGMTTK